MSEVSDDVQRRLTRLEEQFRLRLLRHHYDDISK